MSDLKLGSITFGPASNFFSTALKDFDKVLANLRAVVVAVTRGVQGHLAGGFVDCLRLDRLK